MQTIDRPTTHRIEKAERPLWLGQTPAGWGDTLRTIVRSESHDAAAMIGAAGLARRATRDRGRDRTRVPNAPRPCSLLSGTTQATRRMNSLGGKPLRLPFVAQTDTDRFRQLRRKAVRLAGIDARAEVEKCRPHDAFPDLFVDAAELGDAFHERR